MARIVVGVLHRRFPSVYLAYTWPPPIQYLSNTYPTTDGGGGSAATEACYASAERSLLLSGNGGQQRPFAPAHISVAPTGASP